MCPGGFYEMVAKKIALIAINIADVNVVFNQCGAGLAMDQGKHNIAKSHTVETASA